MAAIAWWSGFQAVEAGADQELGNPLRARRALERGVMHSVPKPVAVVVNFPSNPTAQLADLDFYAELHGDLEQHLVRATSPHQLFHAITEDPAARLHMTRRLLEA